NMPISKAVPQASTARNVMYSRNAKARTCSSDSQRASSSSVVAASQPPQGRDDSLYNSFHPGTARSIDQKLARRLLGQCSDQGGDVVERLGANPESGCCMGGILGKSEKRVYAPFARICADLGMHFGAVLTDFPHGAQDQRPAPRQTGQDIDG